MKSGKSKNRKLCQNGRCIFQKESEKTPPKSAARSGGNDLENGGGHRNLRWQPAVPLAGQTQHSITNAHTFLSPPGPSRRLHGAHRLLQRWPHHRRNVWRSLRPCRGIDSHAICPIRPCNS
eukprot:5201961-Amphidinium_carterae.1